MRAAEGREEGKSDKILWKGGGVIQYIHTYK